MVIPGFISEFPDTLVTDCVPSSGVMGVNKITHNRYPATRAEREALANAMGTQGKPANHTQLAAGIKSRYGLTVTAGTGWAAIAAALRDPRMGVAVFGLYPRLSAAIRQHGNDPNFGGGHCIYAQPNGAGGIFIGDPLGASYAVGNIGDLQAYSLGLGQLYVMFKEAILPRLYGLAGWPDYARSTKAGAEGYAYRLFVNAGRAPRTALPGRWGARGWPITVRWSYATASAYALRIFNNNPAYRP